MVKHTIEISEIANIKIKVIKSQNKLNSVSDVIEKVLNEQNVVIK